MGEEKEGRGGEEEKKRESGAEKKNRARLKEEYLALSAKHGLPDYETLDREFGAGSIDPEDNLLRETLKSIHEQVETYMRLLENLLQPDTKLSDMKEAGNLGKEDQALITETHRKLMLLNRSILLADLNFSEKEAAETINNSYREWQALKKDLRRILEKMKGTWEPGPAKEKYGGGYFG
jgi:hypothetical protein